MTKHTPGPWKASLANAEGYSHINASNWGALAEVVVMTEDSYNDGKLEVSLEGEANARLIAAAPELLEVCKMALEALPSTKEAYPVFNRLQAVIAKAEGRQ